jgi:hypothetical protein
MKKTIPVSLWPTTRRGHVLLTSVYIIALGSVIDTDTLLSSPHPRYIILSLSSNNNSSKFCLGLISAVSFPFRVLSIPEIQIVFHFFWIFHEHICSLYAVYTRSLNRSLSRPMLQYVCGLWVHLDSLTNNICEHADQHYTTSVNVYTSLSLLYALHACSRTGPSSDMSPTTNCRNHCPLWSNVFLWIQTCLQPHS